MLSKAVRRLFAFFGFLMFAIAAQAQFNAPIQGTVTDQSGAVVSGATITVTSVETNREFKTTTSGEGFYRIAGLAPGLYNVSAEAPRFQKFSAERVPVAAEAVRGLDITLNPGIVSETVTVSGEAITEVQTENANLSDTITSGEVQRLPEFGRDPYNLLRLTPGVFGDAA